MHVCHFLLQLQLQESKEHKDQVIHTLQKTVLRQEAELKDLSHQIFTKEEELQQTHTQQGEHANVLMELEIMKVKALQLEEASQRARTAEKLAQEEASYYKKLATQLHIMDLGKPIKVLLSCPYVLIFSA